MEAFYGIDEKRANRRRLKLISGSKKSKAPISVKYANQGTFNFGNFGDFGNFGNLEF